MPIDGSPGQAGQTSGSIIGPSTRCLLCCIVLDSILASLPALLDSTGHEGPQPFHEDQDRLAAGLARRSPAETPVLLAQGAIHGTTNHFVSWWEAWNARDRGLTSPNR